MNIRSDDQATDLKIVSGGQTGVDRAALDVAMELGLDCGGSCPKGRRAEDGTIPERYPLRETGSERYESRTRWNVSDADATLIITAQLPLTGGTELTHRLALQLEKPVLIIDLNNTNIEAAKAWLSSYPIKILNVAGPRASQQPEIYEKAKTFLYRFLN